MAQPQKHDAPTKHISSLDPKVDDSTKITAATSTYLQLETKRMSHVFLIIFIILICMSQIPLMVLYIGTRFSTQAVFFPNISSFSTSNRTSHMHQITQTSTPNKPKESLNKDLPIYIPLIGRLGNKMFQLASGLGIADKNRRPLVIPPDSDAALKKVFQPTQTKYYTVGNPPKGIQVEEEKLGAYGNEQVRFFSLPPNPLRIDGYLQSWHYFSNMSSQIRDIFTVPESIRKQSRNYMRALKEKIRVPDITFVAIHVRRGDYDTKSQHNRGVRLPKKSYLVKAMDYFRIHYKDVHFIICSDDPQWCQKELAVYPNITVSHNSVQEDFATLVECDHMIVTFGSFGWWAAWLNGGDVVYFDTPYSGPRELRNKQMKERYFLSYWNPIGN